MWSALFTLLLCLAGLCGCVPVGPAEAGAMDEYAAALASLNAPRAAWASYLATLSRDAPPALRVATSTELNDIRTASYEALPSVMRMGILEGDAAFIGRTRAGRLVFNAPHLHGVTMHVPAEGHLLADQLIALHGAGAGEVVHYGYTPTHGYGPHDDLHDIAIKLGEAYVVRERVPINRIGWTSNNDWTSSTADERARQRGLQRLSGPWPSHVESSYPNL